MNTKPTLLVSACLLGHETRYNGAHKYCDSLFDGAFSAFELQSICPELALGLGVPRPPINLFTRQNRIEIFVENERGKNITAAMREFCQAYMANIPGFCGIVLKKNSPSCGISGVKLYRPTNSSALVKEDGIGEFAYQILAFLRSQQLNIPIIDEDVLRQDDLKQNFIKCALAQWKARVQA